MTTIDANGVVEFRFFRPNARDVSVTGDFIGWGESLPMSVDENGWWVARLQMKPGEYRFRYVADGTWFTDFASNGIEFGKLGWNSVLVVPARLKEQKPVKVSESSLQVV